MQTLDISLLALPDSVKVGIRDGQTIAVRDGAEIVGYIIPAISQTGPRPCGLSKGEFTVPDDFNDPLPEIEAEIYGKP